GRDYISFASLAAHRDALAAAAARAGGLAGLVFVLIYGALTALSVPGAALLTLTGGFLFGAWRGAVYALIGATLGATAVFLSARAGLAGAAAYGGARLQRLESGFRENAFYYLLCLRLVPVFPFWLVNLTAGATGMRLTTYVAATFLGMMPGAYVYASIGNGLGGLIETGERPDHYAMFRPAILLPLLGLALLVLAPVVYKHWSGRRRQSAP
ncbi:MAG: TVP38/TMEM64 family protein, partial [Alphaproteobacteria bacterium]|nr:TVP38/TMEM64 family protein [Alphaproteobacteria bacterium]